MKSPSIEFDFDLDAELAELDVNTDLFLEDHLAAPPTWPEEIMAREAEDARRGGVILAILRDRLETQVVRNLGLDSWEPGNVAQLVENLLTGLAITQNGSAAAMGKYGYGRSTDDERRRAGVVRQQLERAYEAAKHAADAGSSAFT